MGFLDFVKDVGSGMIKKSKEYNEIITRLQGYSDEKLLNIVNDTGFFNSSSSDERRFAKMILAKRGHKV